MTVIKDKRKTSDNLPIQSDEEWLEYILPNAIRLELDCVSIENLRTISGLHTQSNAYYVYNYLVWFKDDNSPRNFRRKTKTPVPNIA